MSPKRTHEDTGSERTAERPAKKAAHRSFAVGPQHLPDGTYRRKVQKIKRRLIEKAKVRRDYARLKGQTDGPAPNHTVVEPELLRESDILHHAPAISSETRRDQYDERFLNRAKQSLSDADDAKCILRDAQRTAKARADHIEHLNSTGARREVRHPRPFEKESRIADLRQQEAQARQQAKAEAIRERDHKAAERERFRKAMAKARTGGKNGQRKLGRESSVLLEKIQRSMGS